MRHADSFARIPANSISGARSQPEYKSEFVQSPVLGVLIQPSHRGGLVEFQNSYLSTLPGDGHLYGGNTMCSACMLFLVRCARTFSISIVAEMTSTPERENWELHYEFVQHASTEPVSVAVFLFERTPINVSAARSESTLSAADFIFICFVLYDHL